MSKIFEDEFMEVQAGMISLCKEFIKGEAEKIYVYCCMESTVKGFDAFFLKDGKVVHAGDLELPVDWQTKFLRFGMEDIGTLEKVCEKYGRPSPTEIKMIYDADRKSVV